ncbi:MAG: ATP-binding cassette domain-containing protein, partial [Candidatus Thiodiazotropha endolucinida]
MPLITLRRLHLSYGDRPLLDDIDLNIEKGERIALLGSNGAGKSNMMRVIQ